MRRLSSFYTFKKNTAIVLFLPLLIVFILLLLPAVFDVFFRSESYSIFDRVVKPLVSVALFLIPIVLFHRKLKLYFYLLSIWIILSPLFIIVALWFDLRPNFTLVALLLQTNKTELEEVSKGYVVPFLLITLAYLSVYITAVRLNRISRLKLPLALGLSVLGIAIFGGYAIKKRYQDYYKVVDITEENYPLSVLSGLHQAYSFIKKNNLNESAQFRFNAFNKDTIGQRKIHVFVIGESSRYDKWEINGYNRPTNPFLKNRKDLLRFSNVTSGCNLTWMSVPQMITRANPENIDAQFKEKSILSAFKDAGYKTIWLSNQSDKEIFFSGTITLHAKTADYSIFSPDNAPNFASHKYYDERMLPLLDSVLKSDDKSVFLVVHTLGNHWIYSDRYPKKFDVFKPSENIDLVNLSLKNKDAIQNSYDNSILYADYFIDSVIRTVEKFQALSSVVFLSDHGDDFFDKYPDKVNFHFFPSPVTLHVPMFVWTSPSYQKSYQDKLDFLKQHCNQKIGPENTFYTLLDLANISFKGYDSSKSIANSAFKQSLQLYYDNEQKRAFPYDALKP